MPGSLAGKYIRVGSWRIYLCSLEASFLLLGGFIEGLPQDGAFLQPVSHRLAHFVGGEAGTHGPWEEFVIVERVHGIAGGKVKCEEPVGG